MRRPLMALILSLTPAAALAAPAAEPPRLHYVAGPPVTFATHAELDGYGFAFGPSDGTFGAIPLGGGRYRFYGAAGAKPLCTGSRSVVTGTFSFSGTFAHVSDGGGCRPIFGPGDGPAGWRFARDYAGGGQVVPFAAGGRSGWLMPFHAEVWWRNPAALDGQCSVVGGAGSKVRCFYSSIGLAVSTDAGRSFRIAGEILEPSQPLSAFIGGERNMTVGYGSLVVADAEGRHLDNPPADPAKAYFYLLFADLWPGAPGPCARFICAGLARAPYVALVEAALAGEPHRLARAFRKYDGAMPDPWTEPATSDTPDLSGTAGHYAPLWSDEPGGGQVLYDRAFDVYLAVYQTGVGIRLRASRDLIHWSGPLGEPIREPGRTLYYPTLIGETGDPTIAGAAPRLYFSSFPTGAFPDYKTALFESVELKLAPEP